MLYHVANDSFVMIQKPEARSVTAEAIGSDEAIGYILKRRSLAKKELALNGA